MRDSTFLITCFVFTPLNFLFGQYHLEVIDSMIIGAKGTSKAIVMDNRLGERCEYVFNDDGKLVLNIRTWLSDVRKNDMEKTLPHLMIDTIHFDDVSTTDISYEYLLEKGTGSYQPTLIKTDTLVPEHTKVIRNGDTTICIYDSPIGLKNTFVSKNGKYTYFQREIRARKSGKTDSISWNIYYDRNRVFFIDPDFLFIYVLHYKYGLPVKLEYSRAPSKTDVSTADFIVKNYRKLSVRETTLIRYGENSSCLENTITDLKTMENFKKANFLSD